MQIKFNQSLYGVCTTASWHRIVTGMCESGEIKLKGDEVITALNITADGVTFRIKKTSNIKAKANCIFVSVWDGGTEVRSKAHYDPSTGEVTVLESHDAEVGLLDREFIEFGEDTLPVCKECHESVRQPNTPANTECRNPDCPSRETA